MPSKRTVQRQTEPGTEYIKAYGEKLRTLRMKRGLSQKSVADVLGTTQACIAWWETGGRWPQLPDIPVLASLYGVNPADLLPALPDDVIIPHPDDAEK